MQTTTNSRANRIPRIAPQGLSLYRRLHTAMRILALRRELRRLGRQLDRIEKRLDANATEAHALAQLFQKSAHIEGRRRALRNELQAVGQQYHAVRKQIDDLTAVLA